MVKKTGSVSLFRNMVLLVIVQLVIGLSALRGNIKERATDFKNADYLFETGNYKDALELYLSHLKDSSKSNGYLNYKIGECYLELSPKKKAIGYLMAAYKSDSTNYPEIYFNLGKAFQYGYKFEEAIEWYKRALNNKTNIDQIIRKKIKECEEAIELKKEKDRGIIKNLGEKVNSANPEYRPVFHAEESILYYTSRRKSNMFSKRDPKDGLFFEQTFYARLKGVRVKSAERYDKLSKSTMHLAIIAISDKGNIFAVYDGSKENGNIYALPYDQKSMKLKAFDSHENINSKYNESSIAYDKTGDTIFFVSDRVDKSVGGKDIFMITKNIKGEWSKPVNCGHHINTPANEASVFYSDDHTLYFSSEGHNSIGGYDIFKSKPKQGGGWTKPVNLGFPVNSPFDDLFFILSDTNKYAFLASNRDEGYGSFDIYLVNLQPVELIEDTTNIDIDTEPTISRDDEEIEEWNEAPEDIIIEENIEFNEIKIEVYDEKSTKKEDEIRIKLPASSSEEIQTEVSEQKSTDTDENNNAK